MVKPSRISVCREGIEMRIRAVYVWDAQRDELVPASDMEAQVTHRVMAVARPLLERMFAHRGRRVNEQ